MPTREEILEKHDKTNYGLKGVGGAPLDKFISVIKYPEALEAMKAYAQQEVENALKAAQLASETEPQKWCCQKELLGVYKVE